MPKSFDPAIVTELEKQFGGEPLVIVEIEWADGAFVAYADRELNGEEEPYPFLISVGDFDTTRIVEGASDSQQVNIVLNDIDGSIRGIIDAHDIHLNRVKISLGFQGVPFAARALMFEGNINSPIIWDEGARTFSFTVLSKIEALESGFTMEDGDFPFVDPAQQNKPWPIVFGEVCNMEAVQVTALRKGFLGEGVGVKDFTIDDRLCQAKKLFCPTRQAQTGEDANGTAVGDTQLGGGEFINVRNNKPDPQCVRRRFNKICEIIFEKAQQEAFVKDVFTVRGGNEFPQGEVITILIGDVRFEGTMVGETFTVSQVFHPDEDDIENPECRDIGEAEWGWRFKPCEGEIPATVGECTSGSQCDFDTDVVNGSGAVWAYFDTFERSRFIWLAPGTDVFLAEESEVLNIVSLIPGTVTQVAAYRNFADTSLLMAVDPARYTVVTTDYGGYDVTEVRLTAPLSTILDEDWDDEIFVSFTSSVGPSPVDAIEWLIDTYTDFTVDAASFASVKTDLTGYPSNFFVKRRENVLTLIRDIAYQARCALFIRDNTVFLTYLSKEPASLRTLTEDDILSNTFRITHTGTEDLETRQTIAWSEGEAGVFKDDPTDFDFTLKHNIPQYGLFDATYDWFTMNIFEMVQKSATFWLIRKSKTWKFVEFETPITHLELDVFDCVTLNIAQFPTTKVIIQEANYSVQNNTIKFKAWTPVLAGTDTPYIWAWPAAQAQFAIWPQNEELSGSSGDGSGLTVEPPEGHPLRGGFDPDVAVQQTDGDKFPSDIGDSIPTLVCKLATGDELQDQIEPDFDPFEPLAEENFREKLNDLESGGANGASSDDKEDTEVCGQPALSASCVYEITVFYVSAAAVASVNQGGPCEGPGPRCAGPCGCACEGAVCFGAQFSFCHSFGALFAATAFQSAKNAEIQASRGPCGTPIMNCGETKPLQTSVITPIPSDGAFGECEDVPDPLNPAANAGETRNPGFNGGNQAAAEASGIGGSSGNSNGE